MKLKTILLTTVISALVSPAYAADSFYEHRDSIPIKLICPSQPGNGTLEVIQANKLGELSRARIIYATNKATMIIISGAEKGHIFHVTRKVDIATETDPFLREYFEKVVTGNVVGGFNRTVCDGDALAKQKHEVG